MKATAIRETSFGVRTAEDLYQAIRFEGAEKLSGKERIPTAYECSSSVVLTWALINDWLILKGDQNIDRKKKAVLIAWSPQSSSEPCQFKLHKLSPLDLNHPLQMFVRMIASLANGTKHQELNNQGFKKSEIQAVRHGSGSSLFGYLNGSRGPWVYMTDETIFGFNRIQAIVCQILDWLMDDSLSFAQLPEDAIKAIWHCNRLNRESGQFPISLLTLP